MRKIIMLFAAILVLAACKKEDKNKDYYPDLPAFTCSDTTDDGKFEVWSDAIKSLTFNKGAYLDTPISKIAKSYSISARTLSISNKPELFFSFSTNNRKLYAQVDMRQHSNPSSFTGNGYTLEQAGTTDKTFAINDLAKLQVGCARLYYCIRFATSDTVITKGHYDIDVVQ